MRSCCYIGKSKLLFVAGVACKSEPSLKHYIYRWIFMIRILKQDAPSNSSSLRDKLANAHITLLHIRSARLTISFIITTIVLNVGKTWILTLRTALWVRRTRARCLMETSSSETPQSSRYCPIHAMDLSKSSCVYLLCSNINSKNKTVGLRSVRTCTRIWSLGFPASFRRITADRTDPERHSTFTECPRLGRRWGIDNYNHPLFTCSHQHNGPLNLKGHEGRKPRPSRGQLGIRQFRQRNL